MKKNYILLLFALVFLSCSREDIEPSTDSLREELLGGKELVIHEVFTTDFIFEGKEFRLNSDFDLDTSEYSKNEDFKELESIFELPNLVIYCDASEVTKLFRNYDSYIDYMNSSSKRNFKESKSSGVVEGDGVAVLYPYKGYYAGTGYRHLRENLVLPARWERIWSYPFQGGGTWNDRTSSIRVNNGRIEFYENKTSNSSTFNPGAILIMHDTNPDPGQAIGISDLKKKWISWPWKSWDNRISEARWKLER